MALDVGDLVEVSLNMTLAGQMVMNVYQYELSGTFVALSAAAIAEAWWNEVKDEYRALAQTGFGNVFNSVQLRELNDPAGDYGEFAIPSGEKAGTRATTAAPEFLATFNAVGVRLSVDTRTTRPGQKRVPFMTEADVTGNAVNTPFIGLVETLFDVLSADMVLAAPALLATLNPIITRKNASGTVTAWQDVIGYVVNPFVTTQVSRKQGRGV